MYWLDASACRLRHPGVLKDLILVPITSLQSTATAWNIWDTWHWNRWVEPLASSLRFSVERDRYHSCDRHRNGDDKAAGPHLSVATI